MPAALIFRYKIHLLPLCLYYFSVYSHQQKVFSDFIFHLLFPCYRQLLSPASQKPLTTARTQIRNDRTSRLKPFDILIVFMKLLFEKNNFEKSQQMTTKA